MHSYCDASVNFVTGIVSVLYGLLIVLLDYVAPQAISTFFDIDVLQDPEEFYHTEKQADGNVIPYYKLQFRKFIQYV